VAVAASRAGALGLWDVAGRADAPGLAAGLEHLGRYGRAGIGVRTRAEEAATSAGWRAGTRGLDVVVVARGAVPVTDGVALLASTSTTPLTVAEVCSLEEARAAVAAGA
jgi:hypothetical protein